MFYKKNPLSIMTLFRNLQFKLCLVISFLCWSVSLGLIIFILNAFIENIAQHKLNLIQSELNQPIKKSQSAQHYTNALNSIIEQGIAQRIELLNDNNEQILLLEQSSSTITLEHWINQYLIHKPIVTTFNNNQHSGTVVLLPSCHPYLIYYYLVLASLSLFFLVMPVLVLVYLQHKSQFLYRNIQPIIQVINQFNQSDGIHQRAPYSHIKEFQIFNETFNTLISKLEATTQNLNDQNQTLSFQANHDILTGLANRQYFQRMLHRDFNQNHNSEMALLFIDSNKFKAINDRYGHQAGDAVLKEIAKRLKDTLKPEDFIARLGGDEFAVIIKQVKRPAHLKRICEKLVDSCYDDLIFNGQSIPISFSVGASYAYHANSMDDFLDKADQAMYRAKGSIRRWYIYHPDLTIESLY